LRDDLAPFLDFGGNEFSKTGRRPRKGRTAEVGEPRFHRGVGKACIDLCVEFVDDRNRRVSRGTNAEP